MRKAILALCVAVASIIAFLVIIGIPQITYESQAPVLGQERVCDEQNNCSGIYTENTESKPKLVFKPIYEISEQDQAVVEDPSAKYYAKPPVSYGCRLSSNQNLQCTFDDLSSSATVIGASDIPLVQSRLSYCNEIIQHRSASLDLQPMMKCLYDRS